MAIELPPRPSADDDSRLALLEDPALAERLFRENPSLFSYEPPRTQRDVLAWTTRRVGTIALAVTAAASIAAGYFVAAFALDRRDAQEKPPIHASARHVAPAPHHPAVARHRIAKHAAAAAAVVVVPMITPRVVHPAPVAVPTVNREAELLRARLRAQHAEIARLRAQATEAAAQAARAHALGAARPQPQARAQTNAATATQSAQGNETATATGASPLDAPEPAGGKPATSTGGGWTEHGAFGTAAGGVPPIWGPADPCTPHGGRTGIVLQMVQAAAAAGIVHLR